ncbi:MAG: filamentous hemagglutinin N-terminal domain-containing protein [Moorea sp. SIOASIH]|uniref:two-partner secretion domain-containing protein n=1 Tax=Moorena sp. SIOASIH TaxID=2607817 RepID=UPI0013B9A7E4|nr:filamentous hemagglutinin N-terminal domain-containing protein [Moorena sp. SIOASIH]NEO37291.1 filamentous hemagglutinin N-terminal domain-containing protein [Moorena sp. SIOASIH]
MKPRIDRLVQASPFVLYSLLAASTALGQITPDNTLGNESSVVTPNVNVNGNLADLIEGGAIRDSNLFHSFSDFNVGEFGRVYFGLPAGVANILSRVTGANVSNILGTLGVLGNANLFVINPNGIFFGPNSRLDLGGSFFGSTADSVLFDDGTVFSALNPNGKPLLTINIPSGLQYGSNPGSITNQSTLFQVPNVKTLGLIGGDINIPGGQLTATDGRIELGSVGSNSVVNLTPTDSSFVLDYSAVQEFQDISLSDGAFVNTSGESGGSIQVQGANVSLRDRSFVFADTEGSQNGGGIVVEASQLSLEAGSRITTDVFGSGQGGDVSITTGELIVKDGAEVSTDTFGEGDAGNLTVDADSKVQVIGTSASGGRSALTTETFGTGKAGDISITTGELIVKDGAEVSASTFGLGDGGNLTVDADSTVQVIGTDASGELPSALFAETEGGHGGDISITTGELIVKDGAEISTRTFGEGDAGNLTVDADSTVQVIGTSASGGRSALFAETFGTGHGGDISITTGELIVKDGAEVSTSTFGLGDGGNLTVDADSTVQVIGTDADGQSPSALTTETDQTGKAGDVSITTGELIVKDGAEVSTRTFGEGDAGNLTVDAASTVQVIGTSASGGRSALFAETFGTGKAGDVSITTDKLMVSDGAEVSASTFGLGDGGNLTVDADSTVQVIGTSADGQSRSALFAETEETGKAGDISITTGELIVEDGAVVSADTFGEGDGGNLTVDADSTVHLIGTSASGEIRSALFAQTFGTGKAGDVSITTGQLIVEDGAVVSTDTFSEGDAGNLTVNADSKVQVIGTDADGRGVTGLFTETQGTGNAGDLSITTGQLMVSDRAVVSARSIQQGSSAGTVEINANSIFLNNDGRITAETAGPQGNIILEARDIRLLNESLIITDAQNTTGGNIFIDTDILLGLGNSDITANADEGPGGRVEINAQGIFGLEFRDRLTPENDITATSTLGPSFSGQVILNTPDVDPTSGLTELPASLVDAEAILANDLCGFENNRIAGGSSFTITGKGGLPASADDPVINTSTTVRWRTRPGLASTRQQLQQQASVITPQPPQEKKVIIEAQGWVIAKDGTIILTAHPFRGTPVDQILPNLDCHSGAGSRE